ncbi:tripartite tricarboxylate transporter substrate binding protein [Microbacteriaceae bacterium K1510]|nr:tripartite tricarboxylate transporter substrate binding protein [Microbacteriaceae bacterium K1510]
MSFISALRNLLALTVTLVVIAVTNGANAQSFPTRPIRLIIPFPPGGLNDNVARIVQPHLQEKLGQPVIVENRAGASGIVGSEYVAKAPPDGHTLLVVASSHTVIPATNSKLPYDPDNDLAAIGLLARDPMLFVVNNDVEAKTLQDFVKLAQSQPGKLTYATPGTDSQSHFVTELFSLEAHIKMLEVPYRGGAPSVLSLISGETQFAVLSTQLSAPQIKAGKLRALAWGGDTRNPQFPDVPTLKEVGFPRVKALQWVGMLAPAKTPPDVVARLNGILRETLTNPDVMAKLELQGLTATATTPEVFDQMIESEIKEWRQVGQQAGIAQR